MYMTSEDVNNVRFPKPRIGKRGYNEEDVDNFLDHVAETLDSMHTRIDQLERALAARQ